jgi:hypothetical protein
MEESLDVERNLKLKKSTTMVEELEREKEENAGKRERRHK